jgi:hypothetical protein
VGVPVVDADLALHNVPLPQAHILLQFLAPPLAHALKRIFSRTSWNCSADLGSLGVYIGQEYLIMVSQQPGGIDDHNVHIHERHPAARQIFADAEAVAQHHVTVPLRMHLHAPEDRGRPFDVAHCGTREGCGCGCHITRSVLLCQIVLRHVCRQHCASETIHVNHRHDQTYHGTARRFQLKLAASCHEMPDHVAVSQTSELTDDAREDCDGEEQLHP